MKKYKAIVIETITSGTLTKTKVIEADTREEAQEIVEQEIDSNWEENYDVEFDQQNKYSLKEV